jgi:hypothetical protein
VALLRARALVLGQRGAHGVERLGLQPLEAALRSISASSCV